MTNLFSPIKIKNVQLKNRIILSPMCQYSCEDGFANDWHLVHYGSRAVGGAGAIISEAIAVCPEGRISPNDLGIWKDKHIPYLKRITNFIEKQGSIPGIQLAHAGRKASKPRPWQDDNAQGKVAIGWQCYAPSAIPFQDGDSVPAEMSIKEIKKTIQYFQDAAKRARQAGFKLIELHAAHGYLINEFLSPVSNKRTDEYGGNFENRIRFLLQIIDAVSKVWPETHPLFLRISTTEWQEGAWSINDSIKLAEIVKSMGVDLIDCSTGGNIAGVKIPTKPLYQVEFAASIKNATGILTGTVGLITTPTEANSIIVENKADVVLLGRELLRDPYFPLRAATELGMEISWPNQYRRAKK